ncbi:MAG: TonB C-terminal domain-containing protein [candidate division WOR-3 bacterium]|nr:TonB C-terminal domain-containing protein [candidate division WOR-3 bacterium]
MKKELLFSFVGHLVIFVLLAGVTKSKPSRERLYPDVFQVAVVNLETGLPKAESPSLPPIAIIDKKPIKTKPTTSKEKLTPAKSMRKESPNIGLKISGKGGKYSYYIDAVLTKIGSNWINPFANSGIAFSCVVYFVIQKDGRISSVKIEKSSGNELYDRSCERAVIVTQNLPPLMGEFANQESLRLHLEFEFKP